MLQHIMGYIRNEEGLEGLEWIAMAAVIVALILAVYPGGLGTALNDVISNISTKLTSIS